MPTLISGSTGVNKITDGTIVNADINASAAIAGSKISGSFGKVLQVVEGTASGTTTVSTASNTYLSTYVTITPSATSSKVWVFLDLGLDTEDASDYGFTAKLSIDSGSNFVWTSGSSGYGHYTQGGSAVSEYRTQSFNVVLSPSSTSALTYKVYVQNRNTNTIRYNGHAKTRIYAMEIAG